MVSKKRIAVWGLGNHAIRNVIPAINQNENIELYGLCSRNEKVLLQQSKEYKCISWVKEDEMLKDKNLDTAFEYLVMATWIAYLKSKLLLPEDEEDTFKAGEIAEKGIRRYSRAIEGI